MVSVLACHNSGQGSAPVETTFIFPRALRLWGQPSLTKLGVSHLSAMAGTRRLNEAECYGHQWPVIFMGTDWQDKAARKGNGNPTSLCDRL